MRRRHLVAVDGTAGVAARRLKLRRALAVTEAQSRAVEDQIARLVRFRRLLGRYVRALRRVLAADAAAPSHAALPAAGLRAAVERPAVTRC